MTAAGTTTGLEPMPSSAVTRILLPGSPTARESLGIDQVREEAP
jgi:hypothetical protein